MKRRFLIAIVMIAASSFKCYSQWYMTIDAGTSTNKVPVIAGYGGYEFSTDKKVASFIEAGLRVHLTQKHYIKYGSINGGLKFNANKVSFAPMIGFVVGGDQQKQDRHIVADSVIYLEYGAKSANFITMLGSVRMGYKIADDCDVFVQGVYCKNVVFAGVGVKIEL